MEDNGYPFLGFSFSVNGFAEITNSNYVWTIASNDDLYVVRGTTPNIYTISYNSNGGVVEGGTMTYNVTQLPLSLSYSANREFDHFDGFKLNGVILSGTDKDVLPTGTIGNITLDAQWKAYRTVASNSWTVLDETYSNEYVVVDCTNISLTALRTITIESTVKEIAFIGKLPDYVISKKSWFLPEAYH